MLVSNGMVDFRFMWEIKKSSSSHMGGWKLDEIGRIYDTCIKNICVGLLMHFCYA
jgi:hypothetical protein